MWRGPATWPPGSPERWPRATREVPSIIGKAWLWTLVLHRGPLTGSQPPLHRSFFEFKGQMQLSWHDAWRRRTTTGPSATPALP